MKPLLLNVSGLLVAAIAFYIAAPIAIAVGFLATSVSIVAAVWQYYDTVPYKMKTTKDMFKKNVAGEWGYLISGSTHKRGKYPKVTLRGFTSEGAYVEMLSSTRYLNNGDLEIDSYPMELDVEIRR